MYSGLAMHYDNAMLDNENSILDNEKAILTFFVQYYYSKLRF